MNEWYSFIQKESERLGVETVEKWVRTLKLVHFDARNIYLEARDLFQLNWIKQHLSSQIRDYFSQSHPVIQVHFFLSGDAPKKKVKEEKRFPFHLAADRVIATQRLESYFSGETNWLHFALFKESLDASSFNPIYIYGDKGVGKSHLLMGALHYLQSRNQRCLYVKAETFTKQLIAAIRSAGMNSFREFYRQHDVLLIDDLHDIAHRYATQEELFHTFNKLHMDKKKIILAAISSPSATEGIEARLTSRFEWGLLLSFYPLDEKDRRSFLMKYALERKVQITGIVEELIMRECSSVRQLIRLIDRLESGQQQPLSLERVQQTIGVLIQEGILKPLSAERVVEVIATLFQSSEEEILGDSQAREHSIPRQLAIYICRSQLHLSFNKIGRIFSRDHSTIMTSVKKISKKVADKDRKITELLGAAQALLKS